MNTCRSCGASIRWARTTNDRPIPLDAEPDPAGNVLLLGETAHVLGKGATVPLELAGDDDGTRWMPHHATCENWGNR